MASYQKRLCCFVFLLVALQILCGSSEACTEGACCNTKNGIAQPSDFLCRAATECSSATFCTGNESDFDCPPPDYFDSDTVCRAPSSPCEAPAYCPGDGPFCPTNTPRPSGYVCSPSTGPCEDDARCDGSALTCPPKLLKDTNYICDASTGGCEDDAYCNGTSPICPTKSLKPANFECAASTGPCESAAYCNGLKNECPAKEMRPASYLCSPARGVCETESYCTGTAASCPPNAYKASNVKCASSSGPCEADSYCTGYTEICFPKEKFVAGTKCSSGSCFVDSECDGADPSCPFVAFLPLGTTCGTNGKCAFTTNNTCNAVGLCTTAECSLCRNGKYGADCTCSSPAPAVGTKTAQPQCINGIWVVNSTVSTTSDISAGGSVLIVGNLTVPANTTVTITNINFGSNTPILNVTGCAEVNGTILIELNDADLVELDSLGGERTVQLILGQCGGNSRADVLTNTKKSCKKISVSKDPNDSLGSLSVVFRLDKSKCNRWWIILAGVLGGVVLIVIVIALLATFTPLIKYIRPFTQRAKTI